MKLKANHHRIDYVELAVSDMKQAKKFYGEAFGWNFVDYGPDYASFHDGRLEGGLRLEKEIAGNGILLVIYSADLGMTEKKIIEAGGRIVRPTFSFPGGMRFHFADPSGNELAVWSE